MLRLYSESSRPYPGRPVQEAAFSLLHVGKPGGQNRRNKPKALSGCRFHQTANETRERTEAEEGSAPRGNPM